MIGPLKLVKGDGSSLLSEVQSAEVLRIDAGPFNFVWSGNAKKGIVRTSETLIGGSPGSGKTTMLLQLASMFYQLTGLEAAIVRAEQSEEELRLYAERLNAPLNGIRQIPAMTGEVDIGAVLRARPYSLVILDSLNAFVGTKDLDASLKVCHACKLFAVEKKTPVLVVSHVNKDLDFAGFMSLQHEVDVTMLIECVEETYEGEKIRVIHTEKNRFGRAFVQSAFGMTERGLVPIATEEDGDDDAND